MKFPDRMERFMDEHRDELESENLNWLYDYRDPTEINTFEKIQLIILIGYLKYGEKDLGIYTALRNNGPSKSKRRKEEGQNRYKYFIYSRLLTEDKPLYSLRCTIKETNKFKELGLPYIRKWLKLINLPSNISNAIFIKVMQDDWKV